MVMTSNSSPGVDTRWGYPQGGYTTVGPVPPGMGGTPMKKNKLPWQTGGKPGGMPGPPGFSDPNQSRVEMGVYPFPHFNRAESDYRHRKARGEFDGQQNGQQDAFNSLLRKKFGL